jgi:hypothetical protein
MDKEKAIAEAKQRLLRLFIDIQSWNEPDAINAKRERQHAVALLRYTLDKDKDAPLELSPNLGDGRDQAAAV